MSTRKIFCYLLISLLLIGINKVYAERMPGIEAIYYQSVKGGTYRGGGIHYMFENAPFIYWDVEVVRSSKIDEEFAFFELGGDIFSSRSKNKNWLIPYFGLKGGAVYNKNYKLQAELTPYLGMDIYSSKLLRLSFRFGYFMPMQYNEILRGIKPTLSLNFAW